MQQIYKQSDEQFEVYTTVFSPQVCRSRSRSRHVEAEKVVVAVLQYESRWPKELDLNPGDLIQVLFKEDESWWFGRLTNGEEGFFPAGCVEPLQGGASSRATPTLLRRVSVPAVPTPPCGCTSGHSTPKLLRKNCVRTPLGPDGSSSGAAPPHSSPSLFHRVLAKSRRKSCPHLPHPHLPHPHLPRPHPNTGSVNTAFQPD